MPVEDYRWSAGHVASQIGRSGSALKSLRKRGRFPSPDGHDGRSPWWHPETVKAWIATRQPPAEYISSRTAIARELHLSLSRLDGHELPQADGFHRGQGWWLPRTLHAWAGDVFANELLDADDIRAQVNCSENEWDQLRYALPDPALVNPDRWWRRQVNAWVGARGAALRADPDVLFGRDIPEVTGLAADTVRRYRWEGRLPEPDGLHCGRPWWHRLTISHWDEMRNRDHTPREWRV